MSDQDTIREALAFMRDCGDRAGMHAEAEAALAALDSLEARLAEAERQRKLSHDAWHKESVEIGARLAEAERERDEARHESAMLKMNAEEGREIRAEWAEEARALPGFQGGRCDCDVCAVTHGLATATERLWLTEEALREIAERHPDSLPGEHPAVDIARAALVASPGLVDTPASGGTVPVPAVEGD